MSRRRCALRQIAVVGASVVGLGLVACGSGADALEDVDPEAAPQLPGYTEHVAPIMDRYCTACHAEDAQPGMTAGFGFETCDDVRRGWGGIVITVFRGNTMPPGGAYRMSSEDQLTLQRWFDQGARCD